MTPEKREALRKAWHEHQASKETENEMNSNDDDYDDMLRKPNPTGMMDKRYSSPPRDADETRARLRELRGEVDLSSPVSAEKIYADRKKARLARLRAQAPLYQDDDSDDEEQQYIAKNAALLDDEHTASVYAARADARKQRSKR